MLKIWMQSILAKLYKTHILRVISTFIFQGFWGPNIYNIYIYIWSNEIIFHQRGFPCFPECLCATQPTAKCGHDAKLSIRLEHVLGSWLLPVLPSSKTFAAPNQANDVVVLMSNLEASLGGICSGNLSKGNTRRHLSKERIAQGKREAGERTVCHISELEPENWRKRHFSLVEDALENRSSQ